MKIAEPARILVYLPLYIAIEDSEHEVVNYDEPKASIEAVAKGQADISIGDPFLFNYLNYGALEIIIFSSFIKRICHSLITFNPFISQVAKDLIGRAVVSYPEPSTSFFLYREVKQKYRVGNLIQTPFNTELGPLLTQEADVAIVLEPNATYALKNGARELIAFTKSSAVFTGFITKKCYYTTHRKELALFLDKLKKSIYIFENDDVTTMKIASKYFPLADQVVLKEAIDKIREADIYCKDFKFTDEEIREGMRIRNITLPFKKVKEFIL